MEQWSQYRYIISSDERENVMSVLLLYMLAHTSIAENWQSKIEMIFAREDDRCTNKVLIS